MTRRTAPGRTVGAVVVLLATGAAATADTVRGTAAGDYLVGKTIPSIIAGRGGDDVIYGDGDGVFALGPPVTLSTSAAGKTGDGRLSTEGATDAWAMSARGTHIAFASDAPDLTPDDGNALFDIFVKTVASGALARVSETAAGVGANGDSASPALSPDGRLVAFASTATNLVPGDLSETWHVYLKNRATGTVTRLSTSKTGAIGNQGSFDPVFSPDGRKVAFRSGATNLVPGSTSPAFQLYVRTIATGDVEIVSASATGKPGNGDSFDPVFSPDGTKIAFTSDADDLVTGDRNDSADVFVKTLGTKAIARVSLDARGQEHPGDSVDPAFSPDGTRIAFSSEADGLVETDGNDTADIFVKILSSGIVRLVSVAPDGTQSTFPTRQPVFSPDGSAIAFTRAPRPVDDPPRALDTLDDGGVYVRDLTTGALTAVAVETFDGSQYTFPGEARFFPAGDRIGYLVEKDGVCPTLASCSPQVVARTLAVAPGADDRLDGGAGNDKIVAGPGNDIVRGGSGNDTLLGGPGNDVIAPGDGSDTVIGGSGFDTVDLSAQTGRLAVDLRRGTVSIGGTVVDRLVEVEAVIGGRGDDRLRGSAGANEFQGGPGIDLLDGGSDDPAVIDTASYSRATGPIRLTFSTGRVTGNASVGTDSFARTAKGFRIHQVVGTRFDDVLDGSGVNLARMEGGPGNDRIIGGGQGMAQRVVYRTARSAVYVNLQKGIGRNRNRANRDVGVDTLVGITMVSGSAFDDILIGDRKANVFNGGGGADRLRGGPGADEFFLLTASDSTPGAPDVIEDFSGGDFINLTALGVTALVKGAIPSGPKKVARFRASGGDGVLDIDLDSDPQPEARILLPGVTRLTNRQLQLVGETGP